jgi:hypothetical protein
VSDKRDLPRFAVVTVTTGGKRKYIAYDFLTKEGHLPVHPASREEAFALVAVLASAARERKEALSLLRRDTADVKVERTTKKP